MTVYKKELRQSARAWCIWSLSIAFMMLVCIFLFPEMKGEMSNVSSVFSNMGGFTAAFGMDRLNFGELMGFYGIECGNIIGLGGGFFAALIGAGALAGEEKDRTAEFLLTHPISRASVVTQKLLAALTQVVLMNVFVVLVSVFSVAAIGESLALRSFALLHAAYLAMQLELSCICFGISAFIRRGSIGLGLGLSLAMYFMNIVANISESAEFLRYLTPYAYSDSAEIISDSSLDPLLLAIGAAASLAGISAAYVKYLKKDIAS